MALVECLGSAHFVLVGPEAHWHAAATRLANARGDLRDAIARMLGVVEFADTGAEPPVEIGATSARCGSIAMTAIERAVELAKSGEADAIVTAPVSKEGLHLAGAPWPGHTEMLRDLCGAADTTMAFRGGGLTLALATIHVPLRDVFGLLTPELIWRKASHLHDFLRLLLGREPVIGVAGLNPHASEGGLFGDDEARVISPAIESANAAGLKLTGPWPPDTIFHEALHGAMDGVLALYHDQGLIALKTIAFDSAVNVTLGLPIVRTSPDHGTAFGIAGKGVARPGSMIAAVRLAVELADRRARA